MEVTASEGVYLYTRRCAREDYRLSGGGKSPTKIPLSEPLKWWSDTQYRGSICPGEDDSDYCWIWVTYSQGYRSWSGWLPVEKPDTPRVCGVKGGGTTYAVPSSVTCDESMGY